MGERILSEKDKCLDKVFWFKLVVSLAAGFGYGVFELTGFLYFLMFVVGLTVISFMYFKRFVNSDEEVDYQSEIFIEGLNVGIPLFLLSWTFTYTYLHVSSLSNELNSTLA